MSPSFDQTLVAVWRQILVENAKVVELGTDRYPVRLTPKRHLREVDFVFEGENKKYSWAGAEPRHEIPLGRNGTVWQKGGAISQQGSLRGERRRWEGDRTERRAEANH
jgi:hypothetical protein